MRTQPDLKLVPVLLLYYNQKPSQSDFKVAIYALRYTHSTPYLWINFYSAEAIETHSQIHHTFPHNKDDHTNASSPMPSSNNELNAYSDACWVSQV